MASPGDGPEGKVVAVVQRGCPEGLHLHPVLLAHLAQLLLHVQLLLSSLGRTQRAETTAGPNPAGICTLP